jgi:diketogulonate reductase-like aldo/keto reductase
MMGMKFLWQVINLTSASSSLLTIGQLGYGLGTARYKGDPNAPIDKELIKTVVMAIKAGYYHLDGAEGWFAVST